MAARFEDRGPRLLWWVRLSLAGIAVGLAGVFALSAWLDPYDAEGRPRAMGTHHQLGLPPCGYLVATGKPCPSCGMTTSFALLAHGDVSASLSANWVGTLLALAGLVTLPWLAASAAKGRWAWGVAGVERKAVALAIVFSTLALVRWGIALNGKFG